MSPTSEYDVDLEDAPYDVIRLTMPSDVVPSFLGELRANVRGTKEDATFWASIGAYVASLGLSVLHGDTIEADRIAYLTLAPKIGAE
jgi:hypothetical protein